MEPSLVISIISLVVSIGVLIRSIYLDRPNLLFIHSTDDTEESFVRTPNPNEVIGTATLIISNNSSRPNVVIDWSASVRDAQGNLRNVEMPRTTLGEYGRMN